MEFAKETGVVKPNETVLSTRGASKLFAKETGTVKPTGENISTKGSVKRLY